MSALAQIDADSPGFMVFVVLFLVFINDTAFPCSALGFAQGRFFLIDGVLQLRPGLRQLLLGKHPARRALLADDLEKLVRILGEHDDFARGA